MCSETRRHWTVARAAKMAGLLAIVLTVSVGNIVAAPQKAKQPKGLVGHWKLDEKKGLVAHDTSGSENHGTLYGHPVWQPDGGVRRGALLFHGGDAATGADCVSLPIGLLVSQLTNCTIAVWVDWTGTTDWQRIFDFGRDYHTVNMFLTPQTGYGIGSDGTPHLRFAITTDDGIGEERATAPDRLPPGWHHVAVTINDGGPLVALTLYLDGSAVAENGTATLTPSSLGITTNDWLGRSNYEWDPYFEGSLDDFRIYDHALSADEIQAVMDAD